ncbi:MAG: hypothetical protein QM516_06645 [Limnohabitans sp.]|nr:hypothetical protein [Limnohabitans sp.]
MTGFAAMGVLILCAVPLNTQQEFVGFSGIDVREHDGKLMVWRLRPGPFDGDILSSATLMRGDLIESINGEVATLASWNAMHARAPGTEIELAYREGHPRGWRGAPLVDGTLRTVRFALDDTQLWKGTVGTAELPQRESTLRAMDQVSTDESHSRSTFEPFEGVWPATSASLGPEANARVTRLRNSTAGVPERLRDPSSPPLLRAALAEPERLATRVERAIPSEKRWRAAPFRAAAELIVALAGEPTDTLPEAHGNFQIGHTDAAIWYLDFLLNESRNRYAQQVTREQATHPGLRALVVERLDSLLVRGANARASMEALRGIGALTPIEAARIVAHFDVVPAIVPELAQSERAELPEALRGAVQGTILNASEIPELGWVVVGGPNDNEYDLARIAAVFDVSGNDRYRWNAPAKDAITNHRLVVDLAGDDAHTGSPAAALGCVAVIDDHSGNDSYDGDALTAGAALGVSVLLDRAGNDRYKGGAWSLGAAAGGVGLVVDLDGNDAIAGEGMSIGVGGPQGVGAFVDVGGNDLAELGTRPSLYGVAGEHAGLGMGLGVGFRLAAAGGVGAYLDLGGNDSRKSGEFSQGCGYYLGLGILFDGAGDDVSTADRYGLGSAAHQAAGIALDLSGNDSFTGKTAAHLGGAWDESVAIFADHAGDDRYEVASLSLGGAAQQAIALFVDRVGRDAYKAGGACLGRASGNDYHFDEAGLASFGGFFDLGGDDAYPEGRQNNQTVASGEALTEKAADLDGLFIDSEPVASAPQPSATTPAGSTATPVSAPAPTPAPTPASNP